jgi:hypothetical protein
MESVPGSVLKSIFGDYLGWYSEAGWKCGMSAIGSVFECVLGSVLESGWRGYLEAYS